MGCDIHCFVEYTEPGGHPWCGFGENINPGRDYTIFGHLAGVRYSPKGHIPPRGLPSEVGYHIRWADQLHISKDNPNDEGNCSEEHAAQWVKVGNSEYMGSHKQFVTNPDHHSHSWLTIEEYEKALTRAANEEKSYGSGVGCSYGALWAAMRYYDFSGKDVRLIFWFDN